MISLLIGGQDIHSLELALVEDGTVIREATMVTEPDQYLSSLAATLSEWGIGLDGIQTVAVVTGPGSFTSSRVSTLIANAISFAKSVPVIGVENLKRLDLPSLAGEIDWTQSLKPNHFVQPVYDRPPHITVPKTI